MQPIVLGKNPQLTLRSKPYGESLHCGAENVLLSEDYVYPYIIQDIMCKGLGFPGSYL